MVIDLKKVFVNDDSSLDISHTKDLSNLEFMGIYPLKSPVSLKGTVLNKASLVRLNAEISYDFSAGCDRCGEETVRTHKIKLAKSLATSMEGDDSDTIILVPDMKLDLDELIYSEVVVDLPMKHLCRDDCKGICFKCGKNLNKGKCDCPEKEIDPRLAPLAELLK